MKLSKPKYIFVTGGVASSLGKGIISASIARLLQARGYSVTIQKKYKAAVDALFNTLRGSERDRSMNRFREKVSTLKSAGSNRLRSER